MSELAPVLYDFVALSEEEVLVGLKIDVPTHDAFVSLIYAEKDVSARLVKLAHAGLAEDFEKAAMLALFDDRKRDIPLTKVDFGRLAKLLVLAWRAA